MSPIYLTKSSFEKRLQINNDPIINLRKKNLKNYDLNIKKQINFLSNFIGNNKNYSSRYNRPIYENSNDNNFSINYLTVISDIRDRKNSMKNNKFKINYNNDNFNTIFSNKSKKERKFFGEDEEIMNYRNSFKIKKDKK